METVRVLVVDDSREFVESVTQLLGSSQAAVVVGSAASAPEALTMISRLEPDLVLMDLSLPRMNGLEATRRIKAGPDPPYVVILTLYDEPEYREAACAVGADGFVAKRECATQLPQTVRALFGTAGPKAASEQRT